MADIKIVCGKCKTENTFSEYSKPETRVCRDCGEPLATDQTVQRKKLSVRKISVEEGKKVTLQGRKLKENEDSESGGKNSSAPTRKDSARVRLKSPSSFILGILVFIVAAVVLVGLQYYGTSDPQLRKMYLIIRLVALGAAYLAVLIEAFAEGQVPGFLALLFPPYLLYYAIVKLDSFWRQGVFFAVVLMLGAELYFMRDDAVITHIDTYVQRQIDNVSNHLQRAGDAPIPKL